MKTKITGFIILFIFSFSFINASPEITPEDEQAATNAFYKLPKDAGLSGIARMKDLRLDNPDKPKGLDSRQANKIVVKFSDKVSHQEALRKAGIGIVDLKKMTFSLPVENEIGQTLKPNEHLKKDSDGWYWFIGKNYKKDTEASIQDFTLDYIVTLSKNVTLENAMNKLKGNPDVEYAIPAYLSGE